MLDSFEKLAWVAGIIEGEGSFFVRADGRPGFYLGMTCRDVIDGVKNVLSKELGVVLVPRAKVDGRRNNRKIIWAIESNHEAIVEWLAKVFFPYFYEKKQGDCLRVLEAVEARRKARANDRR